MRRRLQSSLFKALVPNQKLQQTPGRQYGFSWREVHTGGPVLLNLAFG
jgi:hypothetical protein